jgi:hypothetical protein
LATVTPPAVSTPASAVQCLKKDPANDVLRSLQAYYQNFLGKRAKNAGTVHQLQSKSSQLSETIVDLAPPLQQRYDDLLKRNQSLILQTLDAKGLVSHAINLPYNEVEDFDGSDAVITDTNIKKQKKVKQFVTMLMQSRFLTYKL